MNRPPLWQALDDYWFGPLRDGFPVEDRNALWFRGGARVDAEIRARFAEPVERAVAGGFAEWEGNADGEAALVLLLDQFPRNLWRRTARAFAGDARAQRIVRAAVSAGRDQQLPLVKRLFFYMPLEHSEQLADHNLCVSLFEQMVASPEVERAGPQAAATVASMLDFAVRHRAIIEKFGRYPYRNAVLGRANTKAEQEWLDAGGERFGQ
jgi:uncharacterized protein (DUF924 family)